MVPHATIATLIALDLGVLDATEQVKAVRHLEGCAACRERRTEIQAGIASLSSEMRDAVDERGHPPAWLLGEFCEGPSGLGVEIVDLIEAHLEHCPQCRDEVERARVAAATAWQAIAGGPVRAPLDLPPVRALFSVWVRRSIFAAATLAVVGALFLAPRWLSKPRPPSIVAGTPVRLLGIRDATQGIVQVGVRAGEPVVLFVKLASPPDESAQYDVVVHGESGGEVRRSILGSTFDRSGTIGILVETSPFREGERIEVRIARAGDPSGAPIFLDAFSIRRV